MKAFCLLGLVLAAGLLLSGQSGCDAMIAGRDRKVHELARSGDDAGLERELARHPGSLEAPGEWGSTPLLCAVYTRNEAAISILLKHGASPNRPDRKGITPLGWARAMLDTCNGLPEWLKSQEDFMRSQHQSEVKIQEQMTRLQATFSPERCSQWARIYKMLSDAAPPATGPAHSWPAS